MRGALFERLRTIAGWKHQLLMVLCGAMAALALAPTFFWPLLFISYGALFISLYHSHGLFHTMGIAWCWGFGFFLAGMYWISIALLVDIQSYWWLLPISLVGLNACFALFPMLSAAVFYGFKGKSLWWCIPLFVGTIFAGEWLRGHILTGFPWNLIGYSWGVNDTARQIASVLDIYTLSALTVFIATLPVVVVMGVHWSRFVAPLVSLLVIAVIMNFGHERLTNANITYSDVKVRVVQPNISQSSKWDPEQAKDIVEQLFAMSKTTDPKVDAIVWPETALPITLTLDQPVVFEVLKSILSKNQTLLTGMVTSRHDGYGKKMVYNSLVAINSNGEPSLLYHKHHLVPFGEYVPFREWLPLTKITQGTIDFTAGPAESVVKPSDPLPAMIPLICYEVIFPKYVQMEGDASWILNVTNDDWFGESSGPYQHLLMAQFRATESGKPLIRAANSGVSAVIDPYGRIMKSIPLSQRGVLEQRVPSAL